MNKFNDYAERLRLFLNRGTPITHDELTEIANDMDDDAEIINQWKGDQRDAPQVHYRVNISGLKRTPDATFTIDGDIRDVSLANYFEMRDAFQEEVDTRYPLDGAPVKKSDLRIVDPDAPDFRV